jgi:hypothetical protein
MRLLLTMLLGLLKLWKNFRRNSRASMQIRGRLKINEGEPIDLAEALQ